MFRFLILFFYLVLVILAQNKELVLEAYKKLSQTFSYVDSNGNQVSVRQISYRCKGNHCTLFADGKEIPPEWVLGVEQAENLKPKEEVIEPNLPLGEESGIMKGITQAHNEYRRALGIPDLVWDEKIAAYAQDWANQLQRRNCTMVHRNSNKYGENLAWASGKALSTYEVVKMWYDEVHDYDYKTNSCRRGRVCGHYTQVVWRDSKRLGCGMAKCGNSEVWVCNYDPPGNWIGEKPY